MNNENNLWEEFLQTWPLEKVREMTLDEYSTPGEKECFTNYLEGKLQNLGSIWGGSAFKFGIYQRGSDEERENGAGRKYEDTVAWYKKYGETPKKAFAKVKSHIISVIENAQQGNLSAIDSIDLGDAYKWKIAFLYQNRDNPKIIPIYKKEMLKKIAGVDTNTPISELHKIILEKKPGELSVFEYGKKLWESNNDKQLSYKNRFFHTFESILKSSSLYQDIFLFPNNHTKNWIWLLENSGPISSIKAHYELMIVNKQACIDIHFERFGVKRKLLNEAISKLVLPKGFSFSVRSGNEKFLRSQFYEMSDPNSLFEDFQALVQFSREFLHPILTNLGIDVETDTEIEVDMNRDSEKTLSPTNTILFGPPGTGKTYITRRRAVEIANPYFTALDKREELKAEYVRLLESKQIAFTTFHQSFSYEDFIEGIKPYLDSDDLSYIIEDGIFKEISENASRNWKEYHSDKELLSESKRFETALIHYRDNLDEQLENGKVDLTDNVELLGSDDKGFRYVGANWKYAPSIGNLIKYSDLFTLFANSAKTRQDVKKCPNISGLAKQHASYTIRVLNAIMDIYTTLPEIPESRVELKQFVLVIDEINRGNISKIFGELITLIEESKRAGCSDAQTVILPYSKKQFQVPANLHIIGTMNTADRSIALMDTALRRRFEFKEMMPDPELDVINKNIEGINCQKVLKTINERIEYLYDRDHTIGHAYFIGVDSKEKLDSVMRNKVIPLLQEYFYDDWEKIQIVLGDHKKQFRGDSKDTAAFDSGINKYRFIQSCKSNQNSVLGFIHDDLDEEQTDYKINENFSVECYKKIYDSKTYDSFVEKKVTEESNPE